MLRLCIESDTSLYVRYHILALFNIILILFTQMKVIVYNLLLFKYFLIYSSGSSGRSHFFLSQCNTLEIENLKHESFEMIFQIYLILCIYQTKRVKKKILLVQEKKPLADKHSQSHSIVNLNSFRCEFLLLIKIDWN